MRGRKPKPTILKLVTGNPGRRKLNENEALPPVPEIRPEAPDFLCTEGRAEWDRRIDRLQELGLMTDLDVPMFTAFCQSYGRWAQGERALAKMAEKEPLTGALMIKTAAGNFIQNPIVGTVNHAMSEMARYAAEFGMSPSARARIDVGFGTRPDDENKPSKTGTSEEFF